VNRAVQRHDSVVSVREPCSATPWNHTHVAAPVYPRMRCNTPGIGGQGSGIGGRERDATPRYPSPRRESPLAGTAHEGRGRAAPLSRQQARGISWHCNAMESHACCRANLPKDAVQRARASQRPSPRRLHGSAAASSHEEIRGPEADVVIGYWLFVIDQCNAMNAMVFIIHNSYFIIEHERSVRTLI
jgi:hypothetical protein